MEIGTNRNIFALRNNHKGKYFFKKWPYDLRESMKYHIFIMG